MVDTTLEYDMNKKKLLESGYKQISNIDRIRQLDEGVFEGRIGFLEKREVIKEKFEFRVLIKEGIGYQMYLKDEGENAIVVMSNLMWNIASSKWIF